MANRLTVADKRESVCNFIKNIAKGNGFTACTFCQIDPDIQSLLMECSRCNPDVLILGEGYTEYESVVESSILMAGVYLIDNSGSKNSLGDPVDMTRLCEMLDSHSDALGTKYTDIEINEEYGTVTLGNETYQLTDIEKKLLKCFISNPNRVFSREQLAFEIFRKDDSECEAEIKQAVASLRDKMDGKSPLWSLKIMWGVGYKLEVNE